MQAMMSFNEFKILAQTNRYIALCSKINNDLLTPIHVFQALNAQNQGATLLESHSSKQSNSRFSLLGFDTMAHIFTQGNDLIVKSENHIIAKQAFSLTNLRNIFNQYAIGTVIELPGFIGGFVGYISYEAAYRFEKIIADYIPDNDIPDIYFKFYRNHIVFDHQLNEMFLATIIETTSNLLADYQNGLTLLDSIFQQISHAQLNLKNLPDTNIAQIPPSISVNLTDTDYNEIVEQAKTLINQGELFQIVPSRMFSVPYTGDSFSLYRQLRYSNPSPYLFYLDMGNFIAMGASPEKLLSVNNGCIETHPLAGTRQFSANSNITQIEQELLNSEKDLAEHMMLVDLARNDLGKVAIAGSVAVNELAGIKKFSQIMHLSSTVTAELSPQYDRLDALFALFPAGTVSGAPKIRAMQMIAQFEAEPRHLYGGAIVYLNHQQDLDSALAIRMILLKDNHAMVRTGAGIVHDSVPHDESNETRAKAKRSLETILNCAEGE